MNGHHRFWSVMQSDHYVLRALALPSGTIFLNAFSKSSGSSDASTLRAVSTKRAWRSASVSFGRARAFFFATGFFGAVAI